MFHHHFFTTKEHWSSIHMFFDSLYLTEFWRLLIMLLKSYMLFVLSLFVKDSQLIVFHHILFLPMSDYNSSSLWNIFSFFRLKLLINLTKRWCVKRFLGLLCILSNHCYFKEYMQLKKQHNKFEVRNQNFRLCVRSSQTKTMRMSWISDDRKLWKSRSWEFVAVSQP